MKKSCVLFIISLIILTCLSPLNYVNASTNYYVSTTGNDNNSGTISSPFRTIVKAMTVATAGSTVYIRGGDYTENADIWNKSGTSLSPITIVNYGTETVRIINNGYIRLRNCNYVTIRGIEFIGGDSSIWAKLGISNGGGNNTIDSVLVRDVTDTYNIKIEDSSWNKVLSTTSKYGTIGLVIYGNNADTHYNTVDGCDLSYNKHWGGDSDGAQFMSVSSQDRCRYNIIKFCNLSWNYDDGWDLFAGKLSLAYALSARYNGYKEDGTPAFDGNGYKLGGYKYGVKGGRNLITSSVAAFNYAAGFDNNGTALDVYVFNCTSYKNWCGYISAKNPNYGGNNDTFRMYLKNSIAYLNDNNILNYDNTMNQQNNTVGTDPKFVNEAEGNFRLQSSSPCVNTGVTTTTSMIHSEFTASGVAQYYKDQVTLALTRDRDGAVRPKGTAYDRGAFESF